MRRVHPLYLVSALLVVVTLVFILVQTTAPSSGGRTASAYDNGPGGAGALRRYLESMGATTATLQGSAFTPGGARVLFILGASELVSPDDAARARAFVRGGGTLVLATERGLFERPLLDLYGVTVAGVAAPGTHDLVPAVFADPPARALSIDEGVTLALPAAATPLAGDRASAVIGAVRDGAGLAVFVGSLRPFLGDGLGDADNARLVLGLVRPALGGATVAFDEYHHGFHPSSDVLVLLQQTWPGRALVFLALVVLGYLVLSGRRLGPAVPLDTRPARSSLEYIRGFAGLVRRSGHGEIARRRLRADLQHGLARAFGLDPATPFDRVLVRVASADPARAAEARALDDALARPLREDALLRTVAQIDRVIGDGGSGPRSARTQGGRV